MYLCIGERNCYQCYLKKDCALLRDWITREEHKKGRKILENCPKNKGEQ